MLDEEASRLEIVESCMNEFAHLQPNFEYDDWSNLVKSFMSGELEIEQESDVYIAPEDVKVVAVSDNYNKALQKLKSLVDWAEKSPVPLEHWSINGVTKWMNQYDACLDLCKCLEVDFSEKYIDEDLYYSISELLSIVEGYTNCLPLKTVSEYKDEKMMNGEFDIFFRHNPIHISEASAARIPINIYRRKLGGAQIQMKDLPLIRLCATEEKAIYTAGDLFCERMIRIPDMMRAEEDEYFKAYKNGNLAARDAIIESVMPAAMALAVKFLPDGNDDISLPIFHHISYDDLVQYTALIVCESFYEYYPTPITHFKRFALSNIRKRLGEYIVREECILSYRKPSALERQGYRSASNEEDNYSSIGSNRYTTRCNYDDVDYVSKYGMEKDDFENWVAYIKKHPIKIVKDLFIECNGEMSSRQRSSVSSPQIVEPIVASKPMSIEPIKVTSKHTIVKPLDRRTFNLKSSEQKRLKNLYKYGRGAQDIAKVLNKSEDCVRYYIAFLHLEEKFSLARTKDSDRKVEQQLITSIQGPSSLKTSAKYPAKTGHPWSPEDDEKLRLLVTKGISVDELATIFERTDKGVYYHMQQIGLITKEQNPYESSAKQLDSFTMPTKPSVKLWNEVFNYTSSSYKYLWAMAFIDYFFRHKKEYVEANVLVEKMIAVAWRSILVQKLSFGKTDKMESVIKNLKKLCKLSNEASDNEILEALRNARHRPTYQKCIETLLQNVPYRFLSPWIPFESTRQVIEQSAKFRKCCMYAVENGSNGMIIRINPLWKNYIMSSKVEMLNFVRGSFQTYLQKRNPKQIVKF